MLPVSNTPEPPQPPAHVAMHAAPAPGSFEEAIGKMSGFRDDMCACSDKACADNVTDAMGKWAQEVAMKDDRRRFHKTSEDETKQMAQVAEDFTKCAMKAMTANPRPEVRPSRYRSRRLQSRRRRRARPPMAATTAVPARPGSSSPSSQPVSRSSVAALRERARAVSVGGTGLHHRRAPGDVIASCCDRDRR
jgi:hypothetical protein